MSDQEMLIEAYNFIDTKVAFAEAEIKAFSYIIGEYLVQKMRLEDELKVLNEKKESLKKAFTGFNIEAKFL